MAEKTDWLEESGWDLEPESTGLRDRYVHTWEQVRFGTNDRYQNGQVTLLIVEGPAADADTGVVFDDDYEAFYTLGKGWEATAGGTKAVHDEHQRFQKGTTIGHMLEALVSVTGPAIAKRGAMTEAQTYEGLKLVIERTKVGTIGSGDDKRDWMVNLPVELVDGLNGTDKKPAAKTKGRGRGRAKPAAAPLRDAVMEFAASFEDHDEFVAAVVDSELFDRADELSADAELLAEVFDPDGDVWVLSGEDE